VVLTGGSAVRLSGADKASIELGGLTLLEHALGALLDIDEVVVVGDPVPTTRPVTFTREDPAGGGPAAGVLEAMRSFARRPDLLAVLAVDMPLVSADTVRRLSAGASAHVDGDGAVLVDDSGQTQYLCAVYAASALERAGLSAGDETGLSMRRLTADLDLAPVPAAGSEARDVDTWEDVVAVRETVERGSEESPGRDSESPL